MKNRLSVDRCTVCPRRHKPAKSIRSQVRSHAPRAWLAATPQATPPDYPAARRQQSSTAHPGSPAAARRSIRSWSATAHELGRSNPPSSSRGHPDHERRENPRATATTLDPSAHRRGEQCRQFRSISHLPTKGPCLESQKRVVLPFELKFESLPGGNRILSSRFLPSNPSPLPKSFLGADGWQRCEGLVECHVVVMIRFRLVQGGSSELDPGVCFKVFSALANSHAQVGSNALPCEQPPEY